MKLRQEKTHFKSFKKHYGLYSEKITQLIDRLSWHQPVRHKARRLTLINTQSPGAEKTEEDPGNRNVPTVTVLQSREEVMGSVPEGLW